MCACVCCSRTLLPSACPTSTALSSPSSPPSQSSSALALMATTSLASAPRSLGSFLKSAPYGTSELTTKLARRAV
eukprot:6209489-Pleurochrysis_carterae.AAC.4